MNNQHAVLSNTSDPKRVAFELWAQDGGKYGCDRAEDGSYVEPDTRERWMACNFEEGVGLTFSSD